MKKMILLLGVILLLNYENVFAANSVNVSGGIIDITTLDSDWNSILENGLTAFAANGFYISRIKLFPPLGNTSNIDIPIRNGSATAPLITKLSATDDEPKVDPVDLLGCKPFINFTEVDWVAGTHLVIYGKSAQEFGSKWPY